MTGGYPDLNGDGKRDAADAAIFHCIVESERQGRGGPSRAPARSEGGGAAGTFLLLTAAYAILQILKVIFD